MARDPKTTHNPTAAEQWDTALHQASLEAADAGTSDQGTLRWARRLCEDVHAQVADMVRTTRHTRPATEARIPATYLLLDRAALIGRIDEIRGTGAASYAHFESVGLNDDDLRRLLRAMEESRGE